MHKIGLISDTHSHVDPRALVAFQGAELIVHAGDVGLAAVLLQLEQVAPVTAVLGNCDAFIGRNETEVFEFAGLKFLVQHIVPLDRPDAPIHRRIEREQPDVVIFGHTHRWCEQRLGKTLYVNPGYAGAPKMGADRSVGVLEIEKGLIRAKRILL